MSVRIAVHAMGGAHWPAGQVYLANLIHAVRETYADAFQFFLQAPQGDGTASVYADSIQADGVIEYAMPRRGSAQWFINGGVHRLFEIDRISSKSLEQHQIDILFAPAVVSHYPRVATLLWLPDFQYRHMPEMFGIEERVARDKAYKRWSQLATRVVLMSEAVKQDFDRFVPELSAKVRVLNPIAFIPSSIYKISPQDVLSRYHLPEKFFYLPNQFWKHKNHASVFQAIQQLREQGLRVILVCSGNASDYRHPTYIAELWQSLSVLDIRDQVIYLGLVPREHVMALMRQSIGVINPSQFEGWGYAVEEARALGKQIILSDLPSHREQNPPHALFFAPKDVAELATHLRWVWEKILPGPNLANETDATTCLAERLKKFADSFNQIVREALQQVRQQ